MFLITFWRCVVIDQRKITSTFFWTLKQLGNKTWLKITIIRSSKWSIQILVSIAYLIGYLKIYSRLIELYRTKTNELNIISSKQKQLLLPNLLLSCCWFGAHWDLLSNGSETIIPIRTFGKSLKLINFSKKINQWN